MGNQWSDPRQNPLKERQKVQRKEQLLKTLDIHEAVPQKIGTEVIHIDYTKVYDDYDKIPKDTAETNGSNIQFKTDGEFNAENVVHLGNNRKPQLQKRRGIIINSYSFNSPITNSRVFTKPRGNNF